MFEFMPAFSGPEFLLFYFILFLFCLITGKILKRIDGTGGYRMPGPSHFQPYAVAAFAGGPIEVLKTTLFSLINRNVLAIKGSGPLLMIERGRSEKTKFFLSDPIENQVYDGLKHPRSPAALFSDKDLVSMIDIHLAPFYRECESMRIMQDDGDRSRVRIIMWTSLIVMLSVGGLRLFHGLSKEKPVGFLLLMLVIFTLILFNALGHGLGIYT